MGAQPFWQVGRTKPLSGLESRISILFIEQVFMLIGVEHKQDIS